MAENVKPGDLVMGWDGYYGIVLDRAGPKCTVAVGNGLTAEWDSLDMVPVPIMDGMEVTANFREWIRPRGSWENAGEGR